MKTITCILLSLMFLFAAAQEGGRGNITATIRTSQQAVENTTVELRHTKDSSLVKLAITDKTGSAVLENIRFGDYIMKVTMVNFITQYSGLLLLSAEQPSLKVPLLTLQPASIQLGTVTVTSRKPFIQKLSDRIIVNEENSIVSAGSKKKNNGFRRRKAAGTIVFAN